MDIPVSSLVFAQATTTEQQQCWMSFYQLHGHLEFLQGFVETTVWKIFRLQLGCRHILELGEDHIFGDGMIFHVYCRCVTKAYFCHTEVSTISALNAYGWM